MAERSAAHGSVRARDGARRAAQRQRLRPRRRRTAPRRIPRPRSPAGRRRRVRMLVVLHRGLGARRAVHARQRAPVHPARAAALPGEPAAAPRLRLRLRTAMAARRHDPANRGSTSSPATKRRSSSRRRPSKRGFAPPGCSSRSATPTARSSCSTTRRGRHPTRSCATTPCSSAARRCARRGRSDDAIASYRAALEVWPGAQSARVALMTLLVSRGRRDEAANLAEAAQTAGDDPSIPWWTYWLGDFRGYPAIAREAAGDGPVNDGAPARARRSAPARRRRARRANRQPPSRRRSRRLRLPRRRRRRQRRGVGAPRPPRRHRPDGGRLRDPRQRRTAADRRDQLREAADRRHRPPRCQRQRHRRGARRAAAGPEAAAVRLDGGRPDAAAHLQHARAARRRLHRPRRRPPTPRCLPRRRRQQRRVRQPGRGNACARRSRDGGS